MPIPPPSRPPSEKASAAQPHTLGAFEEEFGDRVTQGSMNAHLRSVGLLHGKPLGVSQPLTDEQQTALYTRFGGDATGGEDPTGMAAVQPDNASVASNSADPPTPAAPAADSSQGTPRVGSKSKDRRREIAARQAARLAGQTASQQTQGGSVTDTTKAAPTVSPPMTPPDPQPFSLEELAKGHAWEGLANGIQEPLNLIQHVKEALSTEPAAQGHSPAELYTVAAAAVDERLAAHVLQTTAAATPPDSALLAKAKEFKEKGVSLGKSGNELSAFVEGGLVHTDEWRDARDEEERRLALNTALADSVVGSTAPSSETALGRIRRRVSKQDGTLVNRFGQTAFLACLGVFLLGIILWAVMKIVPLRLQGSWLLLKNPGLYILLIAAAYILLRMGWQKRRKSTYEPKRSRDWLVWIVAAAFVILVIPSGEVGTQQAHPPEIVLTGQVAKACKQVISSGDFSTIQGATACANRLGNVSRTTAPGSWQRQDYRGDILIIGSLVCNASNADRAARTGQITYAQCIDGVVKQTFGTDVSNLVTEK